MVDFVNFEATEDSNIDGIDVDNEQNISANVSDVDFIDDENDFDENVEHYYSFTNVSRSYEDAMQNSSIDFDWSQERNNYCVEDYDPAKETIDEFKLTILKKKVEDFKHTLLIPGGFENIDSFYYALLYAIRYQLKNKKNRCQNDNELKKDIDKDKLYDALCTIKEKLRLDLDIVNFENQCFSVNDLLNKHGFFLRVYELKDNFRYLIKQDSEKKNSFERIIELYY